MSTNPRIAGQRIRVAGVDQLPPGKGKTTTVGGREVTVYNREGRFVATSTAPRHPSGSAGVLETTCEMPGRHFVVGPAVSPDRLQSDDERVEVEVSAGAVYVLVAG